MPTKSCALPKSVFPLKFKVKSPSHALELARMLIRPFRHWTVGALAVEGGDSSVEINVKSPLAEAFCALGALRRVNTKFGKQAEEFLKLAAFQIEEGRKFDPEFDNLEEESIFSVNDVARDKETHRQVLKMFTKAIHLARKSEESKRK